MGRRGVLNNMPKMMLPTLSWVALISLLKKAPKNVLPAFGPGPGMEMARKALLGCRAPPHTDSLRHADDFLTHVKQQHRRPGSASGKRTKPLTIQLPSIIGACSSRPHTDSFRVHHVVNQEALQLMLTMGDETSIADADFEQEAFSEAEELCSHGTVHDDDDEDNFLHADVIANDSTQASSSMCTCSSSLSASASRSLSSEAFMGWSRRSVDSEGFYSTATSASFGHASSSADHLLHSGPYVRRCESRPSSNSMAGLCWAGESELVYSNADLDRDLIVAAGEDQAEPEQEQGLAIHRGAGVEAEHGCLWAQGNRVDSQTSDAAVDYMPNKRVSYKKGANEDQEADQEEMEIVAEICYSKNPLEDFAKAISRIVVQQQLNKAAQLQELYRRFLGLNAPRHHHTITLAFLHALHRLAAAEPQQILHTVL